MIRVWRSGRAVWKLDSFQLSASFARKQPRKYSPWTLDAIHYTDISVGLERAAWLVLRSGNRHSALSGDCNDLHCKKNNWKENFRTWHCWMFLPDKGTQWYYWTDSNSQVGMGKTWCSSDRVRYHSQEAGRLLHLQGQTCQQNIPQIQSNFAIYTRSWFWYGECTFKAMSIQRKCVVSRNTSCVASVSKYPHPPPTKAKLNCEPRKNRVFFT